MKTFYNDIAVGAMIPLTVSLGPASEGTSDKLDPTLGQPASTEISVHLPSLFASGCTVLEVSLPPEKRRWTGYEQRQFQKLLVKKLSVGFTSDEQKRFVELKQRRNMDQPEIAAEAVESRERLYNKIAEVLEALNRLVVPIGPTYAQSKSKAR